MSRDPRPARRAMAIAAHPDDIEFLMAGTLLLLARRGFEIHCLNLSSGNCGSMTMGPAETRLARSREAIAAAGILGAIHHPTLVDDLEIFYEINTLRRLAAVIREVAPEILLVPSPQDYMEDHTNACRLAVSAAFARGMPNFRTEPERPPVSQEVTIYHAMPHGLRDALRQPVQPELVIETSAVHTRKREALAAHASQKAWLDASQGMDSYLLAMDEMSRELAAPAGFAHGEGWRRHLHLGFSARDEDVLGGLLADSVWCNPRYGVSKEWRSA